MYYILLKIYFPKNLLKPSMPFCVINLTSLFCSVNTFALHAIKKDVATSSTSTRIPPTTPRAKISMFMPKTKAAICHVFKCTSKFEQIVLINLILFYCKCEQSSGSNEKVTLPLSSCGFLGSFPGLELSVDGVLVGGSFPFPVDPGSEPPPWDTVVSEVPGFWTSGSSLGMFMEIGVVVVGHCGGDDGIDRVVIIVVVIIAVVVGGGSSFVVTIVVTVGHIVVVVDDVTGCGGFEGGGGHFLGCGCVVEEPKLNGQYRNKVCLTDVSFQMNFIISIVYYAF